jgi:hypothetical protein
MARTLKKSISSLSFSLNRVYRAISTARPSNLVIPFLSIAFAVFLFGGGLYDMIMKPLPAVYYGGTFLFLYPSLSDQFISDSIISMTVYALGIIGLLAIYQSTKSLYKPRQAYMMLIVGIVLVLLAYIFLEASIKMKLSGV